MKKITLLHKEPNEECFEILKSIIVEDKVLKTWKIDKNTLIQNLPENVVNEFLDFLGPAGENRDITLKLIKEGRITLNCWDD